MISVAEAERIVLEQHINWGVEEVPLAEAMGHTLREPLEADRDFPPFTRVSMDGIAIRHAAFAAGVREFPIQATQAAGEPPLTLQMPEGCIEIMTGAALPEGADTVIRYEDLEIVDGRARLLIEEVKPGQNAHLQGLDRRRGSEIVPAGRLITAAEIGIAATVGKAKLRVARLPQTAVIATGDELVGITEHPLPHQIRMSNVHQILALLRDRKVPASYFHLKDNRPDLKERLADILEKQDVLILSGGVSKGKFDYVPEVMEELGVNRLFYKVQQRPGKPFWFGRSPAGQVVFALPGNPVSAFSGMHRYVLPWLRQNLGLPALPEEFARLGDDFSFKPRLTYYLQVKLRNEKAVLTAYPIKGKGSGDLANLADTDGLLELPEDRTDFKAGEVFRLFRFRNI